MIMVKPKSLKAGDIIRHDNHRAHKVLSVKHCAGGIVEAHMQTIGISFVIGNNGTNAIDGRKFSITSCILEKYWYDEQTLINKILEVTDEKE